MVEDRPMKTVLNLPSKLLWAFMFVLALLGTSWAERPAFSQQQSISLQFVARLFSLLQESSPEPSDLDARFETRLRVLLSKAQSLQHDLHRAEQGGMRKENERKDLEKKGKDLVEEALMETERYLETLVKNLKDHRSDMIQRLYSASREQ
jgi:hypothetical protein